MRIQISGGRADGHAVEALLYPSLGAAGSEYTCGARARASFVR